MIELGQAIKELRKEAGYTQVELGKLAGVSGNGLCMIELGEVFPRQDTIRNICSALGTSVAFLMTRLLQKELIASKPPDHPSRILVDFTLSHMRGVQPKSRPNDNI